LIVGIRLSVWQQLERPLIHQDLSVVALEPAELSTAEQVRVEYEKGAQRTGTPRAILSDGARNLQRATDDFRSQHPKTSPLSDIKHNEERLWFQKCDRPDLQPQVERRVREYNRANTTANTTNTN
ncbi:MAG: hypothetical protein KDA99_28905, partial [Planctomycetales bacterium]|nr:hypothetical protein [Planctomycetales bacterium]